MIAEVAHTTTSCMMCGLIWFVQLAQYPSLRLIPSEGFKEAHAFHCRRVGYVVIPVMLVELATAIRLVTRPGLFHDPWPWIILALTLAVWASTIALQVPIHNRLAQGKDDALIDRLVATNWIRTALWTGKSILAAAFLYTGLRGG